MSTEIFDLSGRTALITGAGTGLGSHFAKVLAGVGAHVVLCARRIDKLEETAEAITAAGGGATCLPMDVTNADSIAAAFDAAADHGPITILGNVAGVAANPLLLDLKEDEWDLVLDTNLKGAWLVAKEAVSRMAKQDVPGSIVNIASALGFAVQKGTGPYSASKAGLIHLTRSMAIEWARHGVRVNAIAPGYYASEMASGFLDSDVGKAMLKGIPQRRVGDIENFTGPILLLASEASAYMTGSVITVDGGHSIPAI